jgi:DNA polymerase-1
MATLVERLRGRGPLDIYLVSKDKDLEQLGRRSCLPVRSGQEPVIDREWMLENKGYGRSQVIEVQTLCGDNVDNIPGVKGVGPKTAAKLINKYGSADAVLGCTLMN